jgi:SAM-dependent methyltransferase
MDRKSQVVSDEVHRIRAAYERRERLSANRKRSSGLGDGAIEADIARSVLHVFQQHGLDLAQVRVLDVGCGGGARLASLVRMGVRPANAVGVDLLERRIDRARTEYPDIHFECVNAEQLDFGDETFDVVMGFTLFSSILSDAMSQRVAREMLRVLKSSEAGGILVHDFRYKSPSNPDVRAVTAQYIQRLFPGLRGHFSSIVLVPPIARRLGPLVPVLYPTLRLIPVLRSHVLAYLHKQAG